MLVGKVDHLNVKFVDYTGRWPNLCSGVLTLEIEGVEYKFGHDGYFDYAKQCYTDEDPQNPNFEKFWSSGGSCSCENGCSYGDWIIDIDEIPEQFRKYAAEIDVIFNENVSQGCCGGCL